MLIRSLADSQSMQTDQIASLLKPFLKTPLSAQQLAMVSAYLDLLLRWNERINLTAVRRPEEIVARHFGESFFLAQHLFDPEWNGHVVDVGSGAGFPAVPISIYASAAQVTLIERNNKKATFLRELTRALKMQNVAVYAGRAEEFATDASPPDVVTLRAVEKFEAAVPVAASLVRSQAPVMPNGGSSPPVARRLGLLIGAAQEESAKRLAPGFKWEPPLATPGSTNRILLVGNLIS